MVGLVCLTTTFFQGYYNNIYITESTILPATAVEENDDEMTAKNPSLDQG